MGRPDGRIVVKRFLHYPQNRCQRLIRLPSHWNRRTNSLEAKFYGIYFDAVKTTVVRNLDFDRDDLSSNSAVAKSLFWSIG